MSWTMPLSIMPFLVRCTSKCLQSLVTGGGEGDEGRGAHRKSSAWGCSFRTDYSISDLPPSASQEIEDDAVAFMQEQRKQAYGAFVGGLYSKAEESDFSRFAESQSAARRSSRCSCRNRAADSWRSTLPPSGSRYLQAAAKPAALSSTWLRYAGQPTRRWKLEGALATG